jgi:hypothetical protein
MASTSEQAKLPPPKPSTTNEIERYLSVQIALLNEYSTAMRERSQPEYLYSAASVGSFGAVAWGVAALTPDKFCGRSFYFQPASVAALGIAFSSLAIFSKILREHKSYSDFKELRADAAKNIAEIGDIQYDIPEALKVKTSGSGYIWSLCVVLFFAISTIGFCMSIAAGPTIECGKSLDQKSNLSISVY